MPRRDTTDLHDSALVPDSELHYARYETHLLTEHELAQRWSVSIKTLQNRRVTGGGVPFLKLGRSVRYRLADVVAFEEAARRVSTSHRGAHHD